jgi:hypothetical protein
VDWRICALSRHKGTVGKSCDDLYCWGMSSTRVTTTRMNVTVVGDLDSVIEWWWRDPHRAVEQRASMKARTLTEDSWEQSVADDGTRTTDATWSTRRGRKTEMHSSTTPSPDGRSVTFHKTGRCRHRGGRTHSSQTDEVLEFAATAPGSTSVSVTRTLRSIDALRLEAWTQAIRERRRARKYLDSHKSRFESLSTPSGEAGEEK